MFLERPSLVLVLILDIVNDNKVVLFNLNARIQFPEKVLKCQKRQANAGTVFEIKPLITPIRFIGNANVKFNKQRSTGIYHLAIKEVSAKEKIQFSFNTISVPQRNNIPSMMEVEGALMWFIKGTFQFCFRDEYQTRDFFVPINYDIENRITSSLPIQDNKEPWKILELSGANFY